VTLFVRALVDSSGIPFTVYGGARTLDGAASIPAVLTIAATAALTKRPSAALSTTVSISASATVETPPSGTDITSSILDGPASSWRIPQNSGYYAGSLLVPAWDVIYTVTVSNSRLNVTTPGLGIRFPVPSNPTNAHAIQITYTFADRNRRLFHARQVDDPSLFYARFWMLDGLLVEPTGTAWTSATITYYWDPTNRWVYVGERSGTLTTRNYGPDNKSTHKLPLYFSPELRAAGDGASIMADHEAAMAAIPSATRTLLGNSHVVADVTNDDSQDCLFEAATWRAVFDPTTSSGINGLTQSTGGGATTIDIDAVAYSGAQSGDLPAGTMLHELGHAMDMVYLRTQGYPNGIDGGRTDDVTYYASGNIEQRDIYYHGTLGGQVFYADDSGHTVTYEWGGAPTSDGFIHDEETPHAIFRSIYVAGSNPWVRYPNEWVAQCIGTYWASLIPGVSGSAITSRIGLVGGSTAYNAFVSYMQGIGAFP
jgi:hypothetical protein